MQRLRWANWDVDGVRDEVRDDVTGNLGSPEGVLIAAEAGFLKKGTRSAGAAVFGDRWADGELPDRRVLGIRLGRWAARRRKIEIRSRRGLAVAAAAAGAAAAKSPHAPGRYPAFGSGPYPFSTGLQDDRIFAALPFVPLHETAVPPGRNVEVVFVLAAARPGVHLTKGVWVYYHISSAQYRYFEPAEWALCVPPAKCPSWA